jgi:cytoskeletal protein CcmA (bactofilin family)
MMLSSVITLSLAGAWLALPLIPALRELKKPQDASALVVYQGNRADIGEKLRAAFKAYGQALTDGKSIAEAVSEVATSDIRVMPNELLTGPAGPLPVLAISPFLTVQGDVPGIVAVMAREGCLLANARVETPLCFEQAVVVAAGAQFKQIQCPSIAVGVLSTATMSPKEAFNVDSVQGAEWEPLQNRWFASGDADVAPNSRIVGDLVCRGSLKIASGSVVQGSIKAAGTLTIGEACRVTGHLVAAHIAVGKCCAVKGMVIAEQTLSLAANCVIGDAAQLATVSATDVTIHSPCHIWGAVQAHRACKTFA